MEIALSIVAIVLSVASGIFSFYTFHWTEKRSAEMINDLICRSFLYVFTLEP